jgi:hypothetical protein
VAGLKLSTASTIKYPKSARAFRTSNSDGLLLVLGIFFLDLD